jgi:4-diphosphocytidyl-2-C-methyl-D-erythritol kinase
MIERAYAKATLRLRVLGRRPDGYHELEALTVALTEPHDDVLVESNPGGGLAITVTGAAANGVPAGPANLAWQAAELAGGGVRITLTKGIPTQAGLGGGSADAAAVLRAADAPPDVIEGWAALLGSDVPVCLAGGMAWMRGRGELVEPLPGPADIRVVVAVPTFGLSTPLVYRKWDDLGGPQSDRAIVAPPGLQAWTDVLVNDLEPAAEAVEPRLRPWREALEAAAGRGAVLAGSGSAHLVVTAADDDLSWVGAVAEATTWIAEPAPGRASDQ